MPKSKPQDGATFEKDLERLEKIVSALEEGGLPLDEALKRFEEGVALTRRCEQTLTKAERRIEVLMRGADGDLETAPFDEDDPEGESSAKTAPAKRKRAAAQTESSDENTGQDDDDKDLLF